MTVRAGHRAGDRGAAGGRRARVVITARTQEALDEAVARLGGAGHALGVAGRADGVHHQAEVAQRAIGTSGSVDLLVNNAGINPAYGPMVSWTWPRHARLSR